MISDLRLQVASAKLSVRISANRRALITQDLQSQATSKMETLTTMSHKEAIVMRIIAVVTLIFLPATFVSTFFSTDIVKYQSQNGENPGDGMFSSMALTRWLELTIPLTVVTLGIGLAAFRYAEGRRKKMAVLQTWDQKGSPV